MKEGLPALGFGLQAGSGTECRRIPVTFVTAKSSSGARSDLE
jgi:hypothetical protein